MAHTRGRALEGKEKKPWRTDGGYSILARGSSGLAAHTASFGLKTPRRHLGRCDLARSATRSSSHATWETASEPEGRADRPEPSDHGRARQNGSQRERGHSAVAGCHDVTSLPRRAPCPETSSAGWSQCGAPDPATKVGGRSDQTNRVAPCMLATSPTGGQHLWRRQW
jgi:hypothetical protein